MLIESPPFCLLPVCVCLSVALFGVEVVFRGGEGFPAFAVGVVGIGDDDERGRVGLLDFQFQVLHFLIAHHQESLMMYSRKSGRCFSLMTNISLSFFGPLMTNASTREVTKMAASE